MNDVKDPIKEEEFSIKNFSDPNDEPTYEYRNERIIDKNRKDISIVKPDNDIEVSMY